MKRNLLLLITLVLILFSPSVYAESYKLGDSEAPEQYMKKFPIILEGVGAAGLEKSAKLGCRLGSRIDGVSCEVVVEDTFTITDGIVVHGGGVLTNGTIAYIDVVNKGATGQTVSVTLQVNGVDVPNQTIGGVYLSLYKDAKPKSSNATLSKVEVSQGKMVPEFKPETTSYTIYNIADTIQTIRFTTYCAEGNCDAPISAKQSSGSTVTLNENETLVTIKTKSEDGVNSVTYEFKVLKGETTFNSAKLKNITTDKFVLTPAFDKNVKDYTLVVPEGINTLSNIIKWEAEDTSANVAVEGLDNLTGTESTVKIIVTNAEGDEKVTYTIVVSFEKETEIKVTKYKDKQVTYETSEGETKTLSEDEFKTEFPEEWEKIEKGIYKFDKDGNLITKKVTKKETKKKSKLWLIILLIVVGLLIIILSAYFIFFRKKKDKKEKKDDSNSKDLEEVNDSEESEDKEEIIDDDPDYQIEKEIEENKKNQDDTMDIDSALEDLMNTKKYDFKDEE